MWADREGIVDMLKGARHRTSGAMLTRNAVCELIDMLESKSAEDRAELREADLHIQALEREFSYYEHLPEGVDFELLEQKLASITDAVNSAANDNPLARVLKELL